MTSRTSTQNLRSASELPRIRTQNPRRGPSATIRCRCRSWTKMTSQTSARNLRPALAPLKIRTQHPRRGLITKIARSHRSTARTMPTSLPRQAQSQVRGVPDPNFTQTQSQGRPTLSPRHTQRPHQKFREARGGQQARKRLASACRSRLQSWDRKSQGTTKSSQARDYHRTTPHLRRYLGSRSRRRKSPRRRTLLISHLVETRRWRLSPRSLPSPRVRRGSLPHRNSQSPRRRRNARSPHSPPRLPTTASWCRQHPRPRHKTPPCSPSPRQPRRRPLPKSPRRRPHPLRRRRRRRRLPPPSAGAPASASETRPRWRRRPRASGGASGWLR
jgi:hypothetical protein